MLNDFGLNIRFLRSQKLDIYKKNTFPANCSYGPKVLSIKLWKHSDIWISAGVLLEIEMHYF